MNVHLNARSIEDERSQAEGELSLQFLKKYISFCRRFEIKKLCYFQILVFVNQIVPCPQSVN